jgi:hypothetical protein
MVTSNAFAYAGLAGAHPQTSDDRIWIPQKTQTEKVWVGG